MEEYPDFNAPNMNPADSKFINDQIRSGDDGMKDAYAESARAAESAGGLLPSMENASRRGTAEARMNDAQVSAILKKGETLFSKDLQKLMLKNKTEEASQRMNSLSRKHTLNRRQWQFFEEIRLQKIAAEEARIAARNEVIGQVMGVAGAIAGAYVGGPMGAAAGYQAGSQLGKRGGGMKPQAKSTDSQARMWEKKDYSVGEE